MEHNKLDAYNLALDFVARANQIASRFPRGVEHLTALLTNLVRRWET